MRGDVGHASECADDEPALPDFDHAQREMIDVNQPLRAFSPLAHQIDQRCAAGDVPAASEGTGDGLLFVPYGLIGKRHHAQLLLAASAIAATMPG